MTVEGGCRCGRIRYEVDGGLRETSHCHCTMCRRDSGAPAVTWAVADTPAFRWVAGVPAVYASSPGCQRAFCAVCGSKLIFTDATRPGDVDIATGSLDRPQDAPALNQTHGASRVGWFRIDEDVPFRDGDAPRPGDPAATSPPEACTFYCLCGSIEATAVGEPIRATVCHCGTCRRITGGPVTAWGVWQQGSVSLSGSLSEYVSSPGVHRCFCATCGATVSFAMDAEAGVVAVALGLLDHPNSIVPSDQTFLDDALPAVTLPAPLRRWAGPAGVGVPLPAPAF